MKKWVKNLLMGTFALASVLGPKNLSANSLEEICNNSPKKEIVLNDSKKDKKEIYSAVKKVQSKLFKELKNTYLAYEIEPQEKGDTLILNYQKGIYGKDFADCGVASGILKRLLKNEGIRTEYAVLKGEEDTPWKDEYDSYKFEGENKNVAADHVLLKSGDIYIDPTWRQFFNHKNTKKDRIAIGTEDELREFYSNFKLKEEWKRWDFEKEYFSSLSNPKELDPNHLEEYAAALYAEKSQDKNVKIPITGHKKIDSLFEFGLDFFKKFPLQRELKNYSVVEENFVN